MDNPSFSWHPISADDFLLETADDGFSTSLQRLTTHTLPLLIKLFRYLVADLEWDLERIHLFGWGQGGSVALEMARYLGLNGLGETNRNQPEQSTRLDAKRLGSATSICGPLLSGLSVNQTLNISTPVFYFSRIATTTTESKTQKSFLQRTFKPETTTFIAGRSTGRGDVRMLQGADEWAPVMKFWSGVLRRGDEQEWMKQASKGGDVYEVVP
jgi:pimeloyl-ACP methyl ester carboxylesterase